MRAIAYHLIVRLSDNPVVGKHLALAPPKEEFGMSMIVDMRLRPPTPSWVGKPQFAVGAPHYPSRIGFPRPPSAERRSMELLIGEMNEAGIRWGVMMGRASAEPLGVIPNSELADTMKAYPGRFVAFTGVDVSKSSDECCAEIAKWAKEPGFVGVSIEPGASSTPMHYDDRRLYSIYEACQSAGLPLSITISGPLCHMANAPYGYSSPLSLHQPARDFPKLPFIISHGAWPWVREVLGLAFVLPNLWISPDLYMVGLNTPGGDDYVKAANMYLADRTLFGTAYPSRPLVESVRAFDRWEFSAGVKQKVLSTNALELLKLAA